MTNYRILGAVTEGAVVQIELIVGKSGRVELIPVDRTAAWRLALDLLTALKRTDDYPQNPT